MVKGRAFNGCFQSKRKQKKKKKRGIRDEKIICVSRKITSKHGVAWKQIDACATIKLGWIAGGAEMRLRCRIIIQDRWIDDNLFYSQWSRDCKRAI